VRACRIPRIVPSAVHGRASRVLVQYARIRYRVAGGCGYESEYCNGPGLADLARKGGVRIENRGAV